MPCLVLTCLAFPFLDNHDLGYSVVLDCCSDEAVAAANRRSPWFDVLAMLRSAWSRGCLVLVCFILHITLLLIMILIFCFFFGFEMFADCTVGGRSRQTVAIRFDFTRV
jgi:1-acyl-sn-glycerol-3-phosphate acyltransferase